LQGRFRVKEVRPSYTLATPTADYPSPDGALHHRLLAAVLHRLASHSRVRLHGDHYLRERAEMVA
jgi:hypothetical protein